MAKVEKSIVRRKPNIISNYFKETIGELKKVNWPTRQEAINLTRIVILVLIGMSLFLGVMDLIFARLIAVILS